MANECPKCQTENTSDSQFCKKCATPLPLHDDVIHTKTLETPTEELKRGSVFAGRYEIIEELGKGGMGKVYRVEDTKAKEEIALKLIKPEIAADKKTIERFRNELTTARKIAHRNVCKMFDLGEEKGQYYLTMEYVSGGDLKKFIRRAKRLDTGTAISIAKQICEGLEEAHSMGIVHRDLKPNNIMIDDNGNSRIMDFGIARTIKGKGITGSGVMIGTPEYMSPEQVEGKEVDQRSDIYSLGIILYEMLTGRLPFEGDTPFTIGIKHKSEIPKDPKELNPQIPDDLRGVILKCLEKEKENRYQSANEVRSELEKIERGLPTTDRVTPKKKTLTSKEITVQFNLKKIFAPAIVVIVFAILGLILWSPWTQKDFAPILSEKPSIAVLPFDDESPQKDQEALCDGIPEQIILALSRVENLNVPAPTSSFSLRGKNIKEIGDKLNVKTVLKGSLRKAGNRVRITPQLVNINDGALIWGDTYDSEQDDIFAIQDEITLKIIEMLKVKLLGEEKANIIKRYTNNSEAYNLYLKGRLFWNQRTSESIAKALDYFKEAIELDQNFALAYSGLADCYAMLPWYGDWIPTIAFPQARDAALTALQIDETLSQAYASLGLVKYYFDWDWQGAEEALKKSIDLNPGYASAHQWCGSLLGRRRGHGQGIAELELAVELDPLSPIITTNLGDRFFEDQQYDKAVEQYNKALEINPEFGPPLRWVGKIHLIQGRYKEALEKFEKTGHPYIIAAYMGLGKKAEAFKALDSWERRSLSEPIDPIYLAMAYLGVRDLENVFKYLDKAY